MEPSSGERALPARPPRVLILGGGFGGLACAKALRRARVSVTVIDRTNHHLFQPLLYQVATGGLTPADIAIPIRWILRRQQNTEVVLGEVLGVDTARKAVRVRAPLGEAAIAYDYLVVATGARHSYFGQGAWEEIAPGLKEVADAARVRKNILRAFEAAELADDPAPWMCFVIVGGGPTGVELAGALAELARLSLRRDFRHIDPQRTRVVLLEAGPRILPTFPPELSARASRELERAGVEVRVGARVEDVSRRGAIVAGELIPARTIVWAAGVEASPAGAWLGAEVDRAGRVRVAADTSIAGHPEIFVIGDAAALEHEGAPLPGVAPVAMQEGRYVARIIAREAEGERGRRPFRYVDKGSLATVGRLYAVGIFRDLHFSGFVGWIVWAFVHIYYLIGFRSRVAVFFQWAWAFVTYQGRDRLILGPVTEPTAEGPPLERPGRP